MMPRDSRLDTLLVAAVIFASLVNACEPLRVGADDWTEQEVLLARLAIHEALGNEADTIAITQARGRYSIERLHADHPRALAETMTGRRRYIADLDADGHEPDGWPNQRIEWGSWGRPLWFRTLTIVRKTLRGELSVCSTRPSVWGSRTLDRDRLARIYARGGREVCHGTINAFVVFGGGR